MEPNILITNQCNQSCAFCFAKKEMERPLKTSFMSLKGFKQVVKKLETHSPSKSIKIMGGEPTLHPEFAQIIQFSLKKYSSLQLFTNGIFSSSTIECLKSAGKKVSLIINASTPGFQTNGRIRNTVLSNINALSRFNRIIFSFTYGENNQDMLKRVPIDTIKMAESIRLGVSNPQKKFSLTNFKKLGTTTLAYIKKIRSIDKRKPILLNCGYTPCMFNKTQMNYLVKNHILQDKKWGCFGKDSSYDIGIDGKAFSCFVYSTRKALIDRNTDKKLSFAKYLNKQMTTPQACKQCDFFMKTCPGPCIH